MQTAVGVFGGEAHADGVNAPPLMNDNVENSSRHAISSLNSPPFVAVELCREHLVCGDENFIALQFGIWAVESSNYFNHLFVFFLPL